MRPCREVSTGAVREPEWQSRGTADARFDTERWRARARAKQCCRPLPPRPCLARNLWARSLPPFTARAFSDPRSCHGCTCRIRWLHYPLSDLWKLQVNAKGLFEWRELQPTGAIPFPRSRHTFDAVPSRGLCILFGGRSVKAATVLSDLYVLDAHEVLWARVELCGVPPSPREGAGAVVFGASLLLFGGRGRICHSDTAVFHLRHETRTGSLKSTAVLECPGMWEHPHSPEFPARRQGLTLSALGSRTMLILGGHSTDDDE